MEGPGANVNQSPQLWFVLINTLAIQGSLVQSHCFLKDSIALNHFNYPKISVTILDILLLTLPI